jgi:hypothetical protein
MHLRCCSWWYHIGGNAHIVCWDHKGSNPHEFRVYGQVGQESNLQPAVLEFCPAHV